MSSPSAQSVPSLHLKTLTNFCSEWFVGGVGCTSVTADQYSPSNLIATDLHARSRGLRVEHYIRPPVTITVELHYPVTVWCVLICLDLPKEAEGRVELFACEGRSGGECRLCSGPLVGTHGTVLAARCKIKQEITPEASLKLADWVVHRSYAGRDLQRQECVEFPLRDIPARRRLRQLQVKITRWAGPKPVTIKWLEVWGILSTTCTKNEKTSFLEKLHASIEVPRNPSLPPRLFEARNIAATGHANKLSSKSSPNVAGTSSLAVESDIPMKFLDELTFEMMALPMLLPSGHCVDKSTLDKLADADAQYGRLPTDPFTGM